MLLFVVNMLPSNCEHLVYWLSILTLYIDGLIFNAVTKPQVDYYGDSHIFRNFFFDPFL